MVDLIAIFAWLSAMFVWFSFGFLVGKLMKTKKPEPKIEMRIHGEPCEIIEFPKKAGG